MANAFSIELRIGALSAVTGTYGVEATLSDGGSFAGGRLAIDRAGLLAAQLDADAYGHLLTEALFHGPIAQAYDLAAARAETMAGGRLRVRLRIDAEAAELHALAWERLRHRFRGCDVPMATSSLTPFSRYVSLQAAETVPLAERPVRLLVAVANPVDASGSLAPIDVTREIELLSEALGALTADGPLAVTVLPGRTGLPQDLRAALTDQGYAIADGPTTLDAIRRQLLNHHLLHLVSHGSYRHGGAALHLEDDDGQWQPVSDRIFVPALAAAGVLPHAVILVACESAARDEDAIEPFVGLGPKLVEAGVPAVIAMRSRIAMRSAQQVMADFYRRMLEHGEVDRALNEARLLLVDDPGADWSTPVLFSRLANGQLFVPDGLSIAPPTPAKSRTVDGRLRGLHGIGRLLIAAVTTLSALVGLLVAVVQLWPDSPDPQILGGTLSEVRLGARNIALGDVYQEHPELDPTGDGYDEDELEELGQLVTYRVEFEGLLDRVCYVRWTLYDAETGERVADGTGGWKTNHAVAWPDGKWTVEALDRDVGQGEVWIPHVAPGWYVVELELYDDRGVKLHTERTRDFQGKDAAFEVQP